MKTKNDKQIREKYIYETFNINNDGYRTDVYSLLLHLANLYEKYGDDIKELVMSSNKRSISYSGKVAMTEEEILEEDKLLNNVVQKLDDQKPKPKVTKKKTVPEVTPPDRLVGALQDSVHRDLKGARAARTAKAKSNKKESGKKSNV